MRLRPALVPLTLTVLAVAAPAARAGYFTGEAIDQGAGIQKVGDLDIARDSTGAVTYVKRELGVDHIFVSRLVSGVFQGPERVDAPLIAAGSDPAVAVSDGGRVTVAYVSGGSLYAVVRPAGAPAFSAPQLIAAGGSAPSVDMSINGVAYVSFTVPGASSADVRVARLDRDTTNYALLPAPLDINPAQDAGTGSGATDVATSADGTAVVVWGEGGRVYGRRVFGDRISSAPQDLTVGTLNGRGGNPTGATDPHIDIEDDSSFAWVSFRQTFDDGLSHTLARRLVGSQFELPTQVDGLGFGGDQATSTRVAMNGRGEGLTTTGTLAKGVSVALLHDNTFFPAVVVNGPNNVDPLPTGDFAENGMGLAAWMQGASPQAATLHAVGYDVDLARRTVPGPGPDTEISNPAFGPVDVTAGLDVAMDRAGDAVAAFVQGTGDGRRLVSAGVDRNPGLVTTSTTSRARRTRLPQLVWAPSFDLWGPLVYRVAVDGAVVGQTGSTRLALTVPLADGAHPWTVTATDRRGQTAVSKPGVLRVDGTPPLVAVSVKGPRAARRTLRVSVKATDSVAGAPPGSGVKLVRIDFGDRSRVTARQAQHVYRKGGSYTLRVSATDRAGNVTVVRRMLRIKR